MKQQATCSIAANTADTKYFAAMDEVGVFFLKKIIS